MFFRSSFRIFAIALLCLVPLVHAESSMKEATYYSDSFDGGRTANGDRFDQTVFSAAICDIPLGQYIYVSKGSTWVVLDANDRPNCAKYPQVIDLSREAFRLFTPLSTGRFTGVSVTPMGDAPTDTAKTFLSSNVFTHLGVTLESQLPTVLFAGEGIEIRGRVSTDDTHVLIYALADGDVPVSMLASVTADKRFRASVPLPKKAGKIVLVVAAGNSFDTDKYATVTLIDRSSLNYPTLPKESYRLTPRIIYTSWGDPVIRLPDGVTGELIMSQWEISYSTHGNLLVLRNTSFTKGKINVNVTGYRTSTPSSLDRAASLGTIYAGSVVLDRSHESIGKEKIVVQVKNNIANFRFTTPVAGKIRPQYYVTSPSGEVKEYSFDENSTSSAYLKPKTLIKGSVKLSEDGVYLLEIVREDGIAFVNTTIARGTVWSILAPLTDEQIRTVRTDVTRVRSENLSWLNTLRTKLGKGVIVLDPTLTQLAQAKVQDMITRSYQWHADPDGEYIDGLARRIGISIDTSIGENIGYGTVSDLSLQDGLEESGVHRMNMLHSNWTRVGIGYGVKDGKVYLVQVFGE